MSEKKNKTWKVIGIIAIILSVAGVATFLFFMFRKKDPCKGYPKTYRNEQNNATIREDCVNGDVKITTTPDNPINRNVPPPPSPSTGGLPKDKNKNVNLLG